MESFLQSVVAALLKECRMSELSDVTIIVPTKRNEKYIKKELFNVLKKPFLSPNFYTLNEFSETVSGISEADDIILTKHFLDASKEIKNFSSTPEKLLHYAPSIISDFNEIDNANADYKSVFRVLEEEYKIKKWAKEFDEQKVTEDGTISLIAHFSELYEKFNKKLEDHFVGYAGMIYKNALSRLKTENSSKKKVFVVGFNALTNVQTEIITTLKKENQATIFWNYDTYYLNNPIHEAGFFGRKTLKLLAEKTETNTPSRLISGKKDFYIVPSLNPYSQVMSVVQQVKKRLLVAPSETIGVICADEKLQVPIIQEFTNAKIPFNVSFGVAVTFSKAFHCFQSIINLLASVEEEKTGVKFSKNTFKTFLETFFEYSYSGRFMKEFAEKEPIILHTSSKEILDFSLPKKMKRVLSTLFSINDTEKTVFSTLLDIFVEFDYTQNDFEKQAFQEIKKKVRQYEAIWKTEKDETLIPILCSKILHSIKTISIPVASNADTPVQVLGLLESRNLDFKTLFFLSVNEGIYTLPRNTNTFLLYSIRKSYGLSNITEKDAIISYYFYSLLHFSENIFYYVVSDDGKRYGYGEKSRYILQIEKEYSKINQNISIKVFEPTEKKKQKEYVPPSEVITEEEREQYIQRLQTKGLSPTTLTDYFECKYKFYMRYIRGFSKRERSETIDAMDIGTITHDMLEEFLVPFVGKEIQSIVFSEEQVMSFVLKKISHFGYNKHDGYNAFQASLTLSGLEDYVKFHNKEFANKKIYLDSQELFLNTKITVPISGEKDAISVKLKGKVDRIDIKNGKAHIIDYKTSHLEAKKTKLKELSHAFRSENKYAFQLLFYAYLVSKKKTYPQRIQTSIVSLLKSKPKIFSLNIEDGEEIYSHLSTFAQVLKETITETTQPCHSFDRIGENSFFVCKYCEFNTICNR